MDAKGHMSCSHWSPAGHRRVSAARQVPETEMARNAHLFIADYDDYVALYHRLHHACDPKNNPGESMLPTDTYYADPLTSATSRSHLP